MNWGKSEAKAEGIVAYRRVAAASICRTAIICVEEPAASTRHAILAIFWSFRGCCLPAIFAIPVAAPLLDIAVHVI